MSRLLIEADRLLGWKPQILPEDGFRLSVQRYLENREWLRQIEL